MLLGEPPRTPYDLNFSLFGIPVRVHPLFWLVTLLLGYELAAMPPRCLTWIIAVFSAILVHEMGHALAMRAYGFQPWITLYGMGGLTAYDQGYCVRLEGLGAAGTDPDLRWRVRWPAFCWPAVLLAGLILAGHGSDIVTTGLRASNCRLAAFPMLACTFSTIYSSFACSGAW